MRRLVILMVFLFLPCQASAAGQEVLRDEFYWLGQMNKATLVINTNEGLLDKKLAPQFAKGIVKVLEEGGKPGAKRPNRVITFEPLLIQAAGDEITMLHAGRSSQDMHATYRMTMLRSDLLDMAAALDDVTDTLLVLAGEHKGTIVPSYTNGVAAQPTSYGHYLLAFAAGFERDAQRIRQYYVRVDRSPMGTTVLNGSSWPLNREKMAAYLGFEAIAYNAHDAGQIFAIDYPAEAGAITTAIALHIGGFIEDVMQQYAQPRPWILLREGGDNTYVSSAMPQKRNPGLLNSTRTDASTIIGLGVGAVVRAHNIPPGMSDARSQEVNKMVQATTKMIRDFDKILKALVVNPERALEELNLDWTASQEVADVLMRKYNVPFRVGHHFASEMVGYARTNNIRPLDFPYAEARRIYREAVAGHGGPAEMPMNEQEFKAALDPVSIVNNRATKGGPQPAEMTRMLKDSRKALDEQRKWVKERNEKIADAERKLNRDFGKFLER